ncbi:hypothetical protein [Pseudoalteromonas luteoviolacea]|uniref:hypothetical protein n=1 Tax=Pseudoalteromonas luteoviolacea TaxID=43657 RepID=UPI001B3976F6|nr:hypothetical protein [Pseudoalteromonas luteoviolacea]MBQ4838850.1 hypothetical protein [Pseudoalteromonas luteoviolacea]
MTMDFNKRRSDKAALEFANVLEIADRGDTAALALDFNEPRGNGRLEFVKRAGGTVEFVLTGVVALKPIVTEGRVNLITRLSGSNEVGSVSTSGSLIYDLNVERNIEHHINTNHSKAVKVGNHVMFKTPKSVRLSASFGASYSDGFSVSQSVNQRFDSLDKVTNQITQTLPHGQVVTHSHSENYTNLAQLVVSHDTGFNQGSTDTTTVSAMWENLTRINHALKTTVEQSAYQTAFRTSYFGAGEALEVSLITTIEQAGIPVFGQRPLPPVEPPAPPKPPKQLDFKVLRLKGAHLEFVRIELDAVIIMNQINVYSTNNNTRTPIHPTSANLQLDIESYTWSLSGTLLGKDAKQYLTPGSEIEITANGHTWLFLVTSYDRSISGVADVTYSFQAASRVRYLAEPYARKSTGVVDSVISPWQIVEQKLQPLGFTLDRSTVPDWTLSANSYSYDSKTPLSLLVEVANACGAIVQPDKSQDKLTAKPRYRVPPWEWSTLSDAQCDHVIDESAVISESSDDQSTPQINCVTVMSDTAAVTTELVKAGTAGNLRANDVISPLQQDHSVNAQLGRSVIANSGGQSVIEITTPLDANGLIEPGDIVRYAGQTGLCISTGITINSLVDVWQHISLEVHHGN